MPTGKNCNFTAYITPDAFKPIHAAKIEEIFGNVKNINKELTPKEVIFAPPATIVYWEDGTRTVVKCSEEDYYNEEFGLALCFMKKLHGNTGHYNDVMKRICKGAKRYVKEEEDISIDINHISEVVRSASKRLKALFKEDQHETYNDSSTGDNTYISSTWNDPH